MLAIATSQKKINVKQEIGTRDMNPKNVQENGQSKILL